MQGFNQLCRHGLSLNQKVTKPPAAAETRWAGILPQVAWINENKDVLLLYEKRPAKNTAALDDGTTFSNHVLSDYEWMLVCDLDAVIRCVGPFIATMEATEKVTMSLVIPMTAAILHATNPSVPVTAYYYSDGELDSEVEKFQSDLCPEAQEVRKVLYSENKRRFRDEERVGHREDLLVCTILDPRFKLMNFNGCTAEMKELAETYLRSNYKADWSPTAVSKHEEELKKKNERAKAGVVDDDEDDEEPALAKDVAPIFEPKKKVSCSACFPSLPCFKGTPSTRLPSTVCYLKGILEWDTFKVMLSRVCC